MNKLYRILFLFVLSFPFFVKAQLEGEYCFRLGKGVVWVTECYIFKENGHFRYKLASCQGWAVGFGDYKIEQEKLILEFKKDTIEDIEVKIKSFPANGDSIKIDLLALDKDNDPTVGCVIVVKDSSEKPVSGAYIDENGLASLSLVKSKDSTVIEFNYLEQTYFVKIPQDSNLKIKIKINEIAQRIINETKQFQYKIISKKKLLLKENNHDKRFCTFKKPNEFLFPIN